jgi:hypothetical protein
MTFDRPLDGRRDRRLQKTKQDRARLRLRAASGSVQAQQNHIPDLSGLPTVKQTMESHGGGLNITGREHRATKVVVGLPLVRDREQEAPA